MSEGLSPDGFPAGGRPGLHIDAALDINLGSHHYKLQSVDGELVFSIPGLTAGLELGRTVYQLGYFRDLEQRAHQMNGLLEFCNARVRVTMYGKTLAVLGQDAPSTWVGRLAKVLGWETGA